MKVKSRSADIEVESRMRKEKNIYVMCVTKKVTIEGNEPSPVLKTSEEQ